nr:MAG TPA: hypothetical protein [Caudoviricetes sp.]DAV44557.1 MAG TPA: hypothetical protein [Caudoviricetes sp.]
MHQRSKSKERGLSPLFAWENIRSIKDNTRKRKERKR